MSKSTLVVVALAAALIAGAAGYLFGQRTAPGGLPLNTAPSSGPAVATYEGGAISQALVAERIAQMSPVARARYQTMEQKRDYVEGLARFELLAAEAKRRGLDTHPDVVETAKKVMVQKLLEQALDENAPEPTEEELRAYYERHLGDYVKPELFRLSHVFLAAPRDDAAAVKARRAEAEKLLAEARAMAGMDFRAFGQLAARASEEPRTRALEGDLRFLSEAELAAQYGPEVAAAAKTLATPGELSPVVQTDRGLHVLKLRAREAPVNLDFETVKPQISQRLKYEQRTARYDQLLTGLRERYALKIDDAALAAITVDPSAPAKQASGPTPGFIPSPTPPAGRPTPTPPGMTSPPHRP